MAVQRETKPEKHYLKVPNLMQEKGENKDKDAFEVLNLRVNPSVDSLVWTLVPLICLVSSW